MASVKTLRISILEISGKSLLLEVDISGQKEKYEAEIIDSGGIIGIVCPSELSLALCEFPEESKKLVSDLRKKLRQ